MTDVFVRSSDADRCHMSGGTFLAGLFPPKEEEVWNSDLLWQPVPIRSLPRNEDNVSIIIHFLVTSTIYDIITEHNCVRL